MTLPLRWPETYLAFTTRKTIQFNIAQERFYFRTHIKLPQYLKIGSCKTGFGGNF